MVGSNGNLALFFLDLIALHNDKKDYLVDQSYMRWAMDLFWGIENPDIDSSMGFKAGQRMWPQLCSIFVAFYFVSWVIFQVNVHCFLNISIGKTWNDTLKRISSEKKLWVYISFKTNVVLFL